MKELPHTCCMISGAVAGSLHDCAGARPGTPPPPSSCLGQACSITAPQSASSHHQSQCKCTAAAQGSLGSLTRVPGHRGRRSARPFRGFDKRPWWGASRDSPCPAGLASTAGTACRSACAAWALHAGAGPSQAALHATPGWPSRGFCAPAPTAWTQHKAATAGPGYGTGCCATSSWSAGTSPCPPARWTRPAGSQ